jgi:hypothetical protein
MTVIGIDPGLKGAICVLDGTRVVHLEDLPVHKVQHGQRAKVRNELDLHAIAAVLKRHAPDHVYIEKVHAMPWRPKKKPGEQPPEEKPEKGATSSWRFAESFGQLQGLLVGVSIGAAMDIPLTMVDPKVWQTHHGVGKERDGYRQRAVQLFPQTADKLGHKKDHNRAAALLLADYGAALPDRRRSSVQT